MKSVNTYGMKIKGLRKASGETQNYGVYSGSYTELFFNRSTGEVWGKYQYSLGQNSWTVYHDADVIKVCNTTAHMTMQQIADAIRNALAMEAAYAY